MIKTLGLKKVVDVAVIISGFATALSALFLYKQNKYSKPKKSISILENPLMWGRKSNVGIKICNSSSYPVIVDSVQVINTISEKVGNIHEYVVDFVLGEDKVYLRPMEIKDFLLNTSKYPLNIPLKVLVKYRSAFDNFTSHHSIGDEEIRTVINE